MNFVTWSIRNPVPVIVLFIGLTVAGLISFPKLGILDRPDIEFPAVVVTVTYAGVAPTQMESEITRKVEDAVVTAFSRVFDRFPVELASGTAVGPRS